MADHGTNYLAGRAFEAMRWQRDDMFARPAVEAVHALCAQSEQISDMIAGWGYGRNVTSEIDSRIAFAHEYAALFGHEHAEPLP